MTLLVSWASVDPHGTSAIYIAADSRISWTAPPNPPTAIYDHGRKVFAFRSFPDIVGYCGDVLFPSMAIAQLIELANDGLLFGADESSKDRYEVFKEKLVKQCERYPKEFLTGERFQVVYASRNKSKPSAFFCHTIEWSRTSGWKGKELKMPMQSEVLVALGSGSTVFKEKFADYRKGPTRETSRAVFHCFCNALFSGKDAQCGGAPQLVGVYRKPKSTAINFGIIRAGKRYLLGSQVDKLRTYDSVKWRNDLFEICDGRTMLRKPGSQRQPDSFRDL
jgi:hypothetical protein